MAQADAIESGYHRDPDEVTKHIVPGESGAQQPGHERQMSVASWDAGRASAPTSAVWFIVPGDLSQPGRATDREESGPAVRPENIPLDGVKPLLLSWFH